MELPDFPFAKEECWMELEASLRADDYDDQVIVRLRIVFDAVYIDKIALDNSHFNSNDKLQPIFTTLLEDQLDVVRRGEVLTYLIEEIREGCHASFRRFFEKYQHKMIPEIMIRELRIHELEKRLSDLGGSANF